MAEQTEKVPVKSGGKGFSIFEETWQPLARLRSDMERMFEDFFSSVSSSIGARKGSVEPFRAVEQMLTGSAPAVDLVEKENAYEMSVELPGLDEKDVRLSLKDDVLSLSGERRSKQKRRSTAIISPSAALVHSADRSVCRRMSIRTKSKPASRKGVLTINPLRTRRRPKAKRRSR